MHATVLATTPGGILGAASEAIMVPVRKALQATHFEKVCRGRERGEKEGERKRTLPTTSLLALGGSPISKHFSPATIYLRIGLLKRAHVCNSLVFAFPSDVIFSCMPHDNTAAPLHMKHTTVFLLRAPFY